MTWRQRAACFGHDPALWFPTGNAPNQYEAAKAICDGCPVRRECLEDALRYSSTDDQWGMFGGLKPSERAELRRARRRKEVAA